VSYQLNPATIIPNTAGTPLGVCPPKTVVGCNATSNQNQRRVFSLSGNPSAKYIGYMDFYDDGGTSSYNGLLLSLQKRFSKGVTTSANYTWSHCIGDLAIGNSTGNAGAGLAEPNNRRFDRGNCQSAEIGGTFSSDRRQIFNLTVVWEAPKFSNRILGTVVSGWRLSGIYRATSAPWLTLGLTTDRQLSALSPANQRPVQVLSDPLCAHPNASCWINPKAFALPAVGTLSGMGRSNVPGPMFWQFDLGLSRIFAVRERQSVELRAEAFNLTNSFRAGIPPPSLAAGGSGVVTTFGTPIFGTINSALDPRIIQFALKYVF
jgi:hypothetical protein